MSDNFTGLRKLLWPVYSGETKKVLLLASMMFFVLFDYTMLRDVKDGLVITAPGAGAESISFLKLYGTLLFAFIMMSIYSRLSLSLSRRNLFYTMVFIFVIFFTIFGFILFPLKHYLHASPETIFAWQHNHPRLHWVMPLIGNWTFSLFYIFAELWGTVGLLVLFWQFANEINSLEESRRFYPMFGMLGSFGIIFSGFITYNITSSYQYLDPILRWESSLRVIISLVLCSMLIVLILYTYIAGQYQPIRSSQSQDKIKDITNKKEKKSFIDSIKVVLGSKYVSLIMTTIICYGITINLVEVTWKSHMRLQFPETADYVRAMGLFTISTGTVTVIMTIIGSNILRSLGWFVTAMMTPVILLCTGSLFFGFIVFENNLEYYLAFMNITPLLMTVIIGWVQNIVTKGSKYSMFDSTKEMAYIPLPEGLRLRGKAAADGIGSRLGKSGGAVIQQVLLMTFVGSTQVTLAPVIAIVFFIVIGVWLMSVVDLHGRFIKLSKEGYNKSEDTGAGAGAGSILERLDNLDGGIDDLDKIDGNNKLEKKIKQI